MSHIENMKPPNCKTPEKISTSKFQEAKSPGNPEKLHQNESVSEAAAAEVQNPRNNPKQTASNSRKREEDDLTACQLCFAFTLLGGIMCTILILVVAFFEFGFDWSRKDAPHFPLLLISEWRNGTHRSRRHDLEWLPYGKDGELYFKYTDGFYSAHWGHMNELQMRIAPLSVHSDDEEHDVVDLDLNIGKTHAILRTDVDKHWRHSTFAQFWIHNIQSNQTVPLVNDTLSFANFSPTGDSIAYVYENDLYVRSLTENSSIRVTFDGSENVFNGIPDWIYEEVFAYDSAIWWAPSGKQLAYLRTDDSSLPDLWIPRLFAHPALPGLKYPDPTHSTPGVELWIYDLQTNGSSKVELPSGLEGLLINDVAWIGDVLAIKTRERESDVFEVWTKVGEKPAELARIDRSVDPMKSCRDMVPVGSEGYIDIINRDGYTQLAFFSPPDTSEPIMLTHGEWQVLSEPVGINLHTRHAYFHAAPSMSQRAIYRVSIDEPLSVEQIWDVGKGVYSASFSGDTSYALVTFSSTNVAPQEYVLSLPADSKLRANWTLQLNADLQEMMETRGLIKNVPQVSFYDMNLNNGTFSVREILPSNFRVLHKYSVVFFLNDRPEAQAILEEFSVDFQRVLAEELNVVVLSVDLRVASEGVQTSQDGEYDQLGELESARVLAVAKKWARKRYVKAGSMAIWGSGYGGFVALRTLERDTDLLFRCGIIVAPFTGWTLLHPYCAAKRMHMRENGADEVEKSEFQTLARHDRLLILHGAGDDKVYSQNTLQLLETLDRMGATNYDSHTFLFADSKVPWRAENDISYDWAVDFLIVEGIQDLSTTTESPVFNETGLINYTAMQEPGHSTTMQ